MFICSDTALTDDCLGEKIVPIPQETIIGASNRVSGCVMFGREREQPGILIEPKTEEVVDQTDEEGLVQYRNKIWWVDLHKYCSCHLNSFLLIRPFVEEANSAAPAFARILKEMIILTDPGKPLPRVPKGTISRKQAILQYSQKIDQLYVRQPHITLVQD